MVVDTALLIFIILIVYLISLLVIKYFFGLGAKEKSEQFNNCCPDCKLALRRIKRRYRDKMIHQITFRIFNSKRYKCEHCGWQGLRWEKKYHPD